MFSHLPAKYRDCKYFIEQQKPNKISNKTNKRNVERIGMCVRISRYCMLKTLYWFFKINVYVKTS